MARTRNIKPGFFDNEILGDLPPLTRLLFIGLWCIADREGRLEDKPRRIKKILLGYDDVDEDDVDKMLQSLHDTGFIFRYTTPDGNKYIQVVNFLKHQNPHVREKQSEIPPPPDFIAEHHESTIQAPGLHQKSIEQATPYTLNLKPYTSNLLDNSSELLATAEPKSGENEKQQSKEKEPEITPVIEIPLIDGSLYPISQDQIDKWSGLYQAVDVITELRKMVGWCDANPKKRKTKRGVMAFIANWLSRAQDSESKYQNYGPKAREHTNAGEKEKKDYSWGYTDDDPRYPDFMRVGGGEKHD